MAGKSDVPLTDEEAAVLHAATQDALGAAGALGGKASDQPGAASGGRAGGRFGARFLRTQTAMTVVDLPPGPDRLRQATIDAIGDSGSVISNPNVIDDGSVWGLVPSGALDMSVALVRVQFKPVGTDGGTRVSIRGSGQEGLIKQKIGAKAVDRIAARLAGT